jgi:hypothetical protein
MTIINQTTPGLGQHRDRGYFYTGARNVLPVEYFGARAVGWDDDPTDNLAALQRAINWSSEEGGTILLGAGVYGIDGTLQLLSHTTIVGLGGTTGVSCIQQLDMNWPSCLASVTSTSHATGVANVKLVGFMVDGGWDFKNTFNTGSTWDYLLASKTSYGIYLSCPLNSGADLVNRFGSIDANNFLSDLYVTKVAGIGIYMEGRGESRIQHIRVSSCATDGFYLESPDNWMTDCTYNVCGNRGLVVSGGNERIMGIKSWFIGMCKGQEVTGIGVEFPDGAGITNVDGTNITTQDTWGPGMLIEGNTIRVQGRVDCAGGGRLEDSNLGYQGNRTKPRSSIEIGNLKDSRVECAIRGTGPFDLSAAGQHLYPHHVYFSNGGADQNLIDITYYKRSSVDWFNPTMINAVAGVANAKRHNIVQTQNGDILYGTRTAGELGDIAHSVNLYKQFGQRVVMNTGQIAISNGGTAADTWVTTAGVTLATPA